MTPRDFIRRFVIHTALAMSAWLVVVLALEQLIPGFAAPFVDLPGIGLITFGVIILAVAIV